MNPTMIFAQGSSFLVEADSFLIGADNIRIEDLKVLGIVIIVPSRRNCSFSSGRLVNKKKVWCKPKVLGRP